MTTGEDNIMLDLEAMSQSMNAAIVAIGAARFDVENNRITDKFYRVVNLQSSLNSGLEIDGDTVLWWLRQSERARMQICQSSSVDLNTALHEFCTWVGDNPIIWGNGADFDNVILANAYKKTGIEQPWKFRNNRCYRTLKNLSNVPIKRHGTAHNALDDAISQAHHLMDILSAGTQPAWRTPETAQITDDSTT